MITYRYEEPAMLRVEFRHPTTGALTDPAQVTAAAMKPDGTTVALSPVKESTGIWYAVIGKSAMTVPGVWTWKMEGVGTIDAKFEDEFEVLASAFAPALEYLRDADYESVRRVLGVTKLDVSDELIEDLAFGQEAERRAIAALGGKEAADAFFAATATTALVKLAVVYTTAALLVEQNQQGGWIGYTGRESRATLDPAEFWVRYESYVDQVAQPTAPAVASITPVAGLVVAGPTRAGEVDAPLTPWSNWMS